mgnify:CR=1 FL=1
MAVWNSLPVLCHVVVVGISREGHTWKNEYVAIGRAGTITIQAPMCFVVQNANLENLPCGHVAVYLLFMVHERCIPDREQARYSIVHLTISALSPTTIAITAPSFLSNPSLTGPQS